MRTRPPRSRRRALLPILLAGALSVGATAAAGIEPSIAEPISDSAFTPVFLEISGDSPTTHRLGGPVRAPDVASISDPWLHAAPPAERARPRLPATAPVVVARQPVSTGSTSVAGATHSISGRASWYCDAGVSPCSSSYPDGGGFDAYAAAGPRLRAALGSSWRGRIVSVDGIRVKLIDWCQCYQGEPNEKLLDLYHDVYLRTGSAVTIRW